MQRISSLRLSSVGFVSYLKVGLLTAGRNVDKALSRLSGETIPLFPISLKLAKRRCLVVGAGKTAEEKILSLLRCGATVIVVAPAATRTVKAWAANGKIIWQQRGFALGDLDRIFLVVVATPLKMLNKTVSEEAQRRQILCNVVRDRPLCNFYYPAVVRRGPLQIAISTAGHSGALAQRLRKQMETQFGPEWERWLRWLGEARSSLYDDPISPKRRRTMLHRLASQKKQAEVFGRWGIPIAGDQQSRK
jgi:precorrin-2 dehydrogenase / sirohydrochlorin ferrochelatase